MNPNHRSMPAFRAGLIALLLAAVGTYAIFTKSVPFRHHYEVRAVVTSSNLLRPSSPVRIAGVDVGKVVSVGRYRHTKLAVVTMRIDDRGRPVHSDATLKIRPRLFLEGNFYVDLKPGTSRAKELPDGGLIPVTQTATPVQLDQVLGALQSDTRKSLQGALQGLGAAFDTAPSQDPNQDPRVAHLTAGQALNLAIATGPQALRDGAIVNQALQGTRPHDLSRTIAGLSKASRALAANQVQLTDLITHMAATMEALNRESGPLTQVVSQLGPTAINARRGFTSLLEAIPATRRFARDLAPGVAETPATIAAAYPWLAQAKPLLSKPELAGLLDEVSPATSDLARLGHESQLFLPRIDAFNRCVTKVLLPTGNIKVSDGSLSAGVENYKEFWYSMVGQNGEGQGFDGNGPFLRLDAAAGDQTIESGKTNYSHLPMFGNPALPPQRTRPAYTNAPPQLRRDVPCYTQRVPDVNGPSSTGPADGSRPNAAPPVVSTDDSVVLRVLGATAALLMRAGR